MTFPDPDTDQQAVHADDAPAQWAILELMGHQRLAGRVSQQTFGGANLIRVDVPEVVLSDFHMRDGERVDSLEVIPAHTRSLGAASIYSINWCDQLAATVAAHSIRHRPIQHYSLASVLKDMPPDQKAKVLALAGPNDLAIVDAAGGEDEPF